MKFAKLILLSLIAQAVAAQAPGKEAPAKPAASGGALTLERYLEQVKTQSADGRGAVEAVVAAENRLNEPDVSLSSEFYTNYDYSDSRAEPNNPAMGNRSKGVSLRAGVRDKTQFGLGTDIYAQTYHGQMYGTSAFFMPTPDYYTTQMGLEITQSLWRNGFGEFTRYDIRMQKAQARIRYLQAKFELKNLLIKAENTYWALVSYNEIVKLQEENVDRSLKLKNWMSKRMGMRLVDDVDALQAQASHETRELELMTSIDERAAFIRQFNTLRGQDSDEVGTLAELPTAAMLLKMVKDPAKKMTREDFAIVYQQAVVSQSEAAGARSMIRPQLDLKAGVAANGFEPSRTASWNESQDLNNPSWHVGVTFSVPLDYSLLKNLRHAFRSQKQASEEKMEAAKFNEERAWDDVIKQRLELQRRFEKATSLEKVQTQLVKRERTRLLNGRSTTFQSLTIEQNLAMAQIQRVRAQLALLQIHNVSKSFEVAQ
jgi:outer membrane protein TolC